MAVRDGLELGEFVKRIKFGETTEAFIINNQEEPLPCRYRTVN